MNHTSEEDRKDGYYNLNSIINKKKKGTLYITLYITIYIKYQHNI